MDLNSFQRKAIIFIFISILIGAVLLARKEPLKKIERKAKKIHQTLIPAVPKKLDINTADIPQLTKLPGIGPGLAKQIIDYREQHGPYKTLNALLNVPGIGPKRLEIIREAGNIALKEIDITSKELKINLNTASPEQLAAITGVGPKTARSIVNYRFKNGPFNSLEELMEVPRIGQKTYGNIKNYLYVPALTQSKKNAHLKKIASTKKRSHEIDTSIECPHCGKTLWEKGKKKRIFIRCPHCLKIL